VPLARGKSRSLPTKEILNAIARLNQQKYLEIVLSGIHLGIYGHDLDPATDLSHLLRQLFNLGWNSRLRLSSIEPREITTDLLKVFDNNDLLCPHLHIPLQSGDDKILQLMGRNYDTLFYRNLIEKICNTVGYVAIGIDVMAGFPSENESNLEIL
jgi:threonylcarbamoyladenosine tRNA methylthiotransferase MtaB